MRSKILITLLLAVAALPAAAGDFGSVFGQPLPLVAQMSKEERRALRERWEESSPEERAQLRRKFEDQMRRTPAGQAGSWGVDMGSRMYDRGQEYGYGTGYERRHREDEQDDGDRNGNDRRGRGRR